MCLRFDTRWSTLLYFTMEVLPDEIILEIFNKMSPETRMVCEHVYGRFAALAGPINPCYILKSVVFLKKTHLRRYQPEVTVCRGAFDIIINFVKLELENYGPLHCIEHIPPLHLIQATVTDFLDNAKFTLPKPSYMVNASKLIIICKSHLWSKSARFLLKHRTGHVYCKKLNIKHRLNKKLCHVSNLHNIFVVLFHLLYYLRYVFNVTFICDNVYITNIMNVIEKIKQ